MAVANGKPAILLIVFRSPGANIIETVDRVKAMIPQLRSWLPESADLELRMDRSLTIRASLREVEKSLMLAMGLVVLVTFLFLRNARATSIPAVAAPVSLIATFGVMYLCGYSLDNLSLMALTVSTGFVVDDAIVVLENIVRRLEMGESPCARPCAARAKWVSPWCPFPFPWWRCSRPFCSWAALWAVCSASFPWCSPRGAGLHAGFPDHHAHDVRQAAAAF